jgi:hypothetical protein
LIQIVFMSVAAVGIGEPPGRVSVKTISMLIISTAKNGYLMSILARHFMTRSRATDWPIAISFNRFS